jgi:hypothetical protein
MQRRHLSSSGQMLDDATCAAVQIFNGETSYADEQSKTVIGQMLVDNLAKRGAVDLVGMRGMQHRLARSDLEEIVGQHITTEDAD